MSRTRVFPNTRQAKMTLRIPVHVLNMVNEKAKADRQSRNNLIVRMLANEVGVDVLEAALPRRPT